jgi:hypothetical protein
MKSLGCFFGFMAGGTVGVLCGAVLTYAVLSFAVSRGMDASYKGSLTVAGATLGLLLGGGIAAIWAFRMFRE